MRSQQNSNGMMIRSNFSATKGKTRTEHLGFNYTQLGRMQNLMRKQPLFDIIWFGTSIAFCVVCLVLFGNQWMTYLTTAQFISYLIVMYLIAKGNVLGIWLNIFDCFLFAAICFINGVYGELFKTLIISNFFNIYGIINWSRANKAEKQEGSHRKVNELKVRKLSRKGFIIILSTMAVATVAAYFILDLLNTEVAYLGAVTLVFSFYGRFLSMSRYRESWYIGIVREFAGFAMWIIILVGAVKSTGSWTILPTVGCSAAAIANNIDAMITWNKLYRKSNVNGGLYITGRPIEIRHIVTLKNKFKHLRWTPATSRSGAEGVAPHTKIIVANNRGLY